MKIIIPENIKREYINNNINRAWNVGGIGGKCLWRKMLELNKEWFPAEKEYRGLNIENQLKD